MDYGYGCGVELLLAHMNIEDIITATERLYQLEGEQEEDSGGLSQEEMDDNEELGDSEGSGSEPSDFAKVADGVQYGTVADLLSFVNRLSDMQSAALKHSSEEMGVLLSKVRRSSKPLFKVEPDRVSPKCFMSCVWVCFQIQRTLDPENDAGFDQIPNFGCVLAEAHGHEKRPLSDQHGCTAVSMETDLQESRVWSRAKGLIWKSALGSGYSEQEEDGLQTGESRRARVGIPSVPTRFPIPPRTQHICIHLPGSVYSTGTEPVNNSCS